MKKKILLSVLAGFVLNFGYSQEVIASSGGHDAVGTLQVSWTLGEIMTETYSTASLQITQGEQQPDDRPTNSIHTVTNVEMMFYPNPVEDILTLFSNQTDLNASMTDSRGSLVKEFAVDSEETTLTLDGIERGIYFMNIYNNEGSLLEVFKIVKQ